MARRRPPVLALTAALLVLGLAIPLPGSAAGPTAATPAGPVTCDAGWGPSTHLTQVTVRDVVTLGPAEAVAVGIGDQPNRKRLQVTARWDGLTWTTEATPSRGVEGLMGIAGGNGDPLWAVGFAEAGGRSVSIARRLTDAGWVMSSPPTPAGTGAVLVSVDVAPGGDVWAVGMTASTAGVRMGLAWRRVRSQGWVAQPAGPVRSSFSGVAALAQDDVWIVGSRRGPAGMRPLIRHWDGSTWTPQTLPDLGIDAGLTAIAGTSGGHVWAVGWQLRDGDVRPLVLRFRDGAWETADPPGLGGRFGLLLSVAVDAAGRPWVGGTSYRGPGTGYVASTARLRTGSWMLWPATAGPARWVITLDGDPAKEAWAGARATDGSDLLPVCEPRAAAPGRAGRPPGGRKGTARRPGQLGRLALTVRAERLDTRIATPVKGLPEVPPLEPATDLPGWVARDAASDLGLDVEAVTYGADVADLDGDGHQDLFLSTHGQLPWTFLGGASGFTAVSGEAYGKADRHDCAIAPIAGDDLPDIVCSTGGESGTGLKVNELWVDPATGSPTNVGTPRGLADPFGRGRSIALFDADGDGDADLFLGNQGMRFDAQPSPNRLMRNDGTGRFTWDPASGLSSDRGASCARPVDLDLDDDLDLLVCADSGAIMPTHGMMAMRNDAGRFTNATAALGILSIGEVDVVAGQLGGGPRPDLVQLSRDRIRISLWREGRFRTVHERSLTNGRGLALGDVDGDGHLDIYLLRGIGKVNDPDVVLHNDGTGRGWTAIAVPSVSTGVAEAVTTIDADEDGRDDFYVLNGWLKAGPTQLITFDQLPGAARR